MWRGLIGFVSIRCKGTRTIAPGMQTLRSKAWVVVTSGCRCSWADLSGACAATTGAKPVGCVLVMISAMAKRSTAAVLAAAWCVAIAALVFSLIFGTVAIF